MKAFNSVVRENNIETLKNQKLDLLIIGGGITGAGVARDAASRGMKVGLINSNDFAFGTSSRSSKLIHGGVRYLENYEFSLVFEALSERAKLFEIAPHLVHPLRFMIPVFKESRVGMFLMGMGMWLYDALSLFEAPELHERLNSEESIDRVPSLRNKNLKGSYVYSDAYMDDDRLVHETLRSANEFGAYSVNYVKADDVEMIEGKICAVNCTDEISGEKLKVKAKHFISTVGPWTDKLANNIFDDWKSILRPSKGVHLTISKNRIPLKNAVVMGAEKGNRIIFAIPRHEMVIIGTTDTDYQGDPADVKTEVEDVKYILEVTNSYFPNANLEVSDIIASYAGIRPLVDDGSSSEGKTSREHTIINDPRNITFVAGGKYTTYRKIAEDCMNSVLNYYDFEQRVKFNKSNTLIPLNPNVNESNLLKTRMKKDLITKQTGLSKKSVELLIERHGAECLTMLDKWSGWLDRSVWCVEAMQAIETTMCMHLVDFYIRRTPLFLAFADHGESFRHDITKVFAGYYNWDDEQIAEENKMLDKHFDTELAWKKTI